MTETSAPDVGTAAPTRSLTANSTVALVLASIVNSLLHESAHAVAALTLGLTPTISPFSVDVAEAATPNQEIMVASAGPLFSLVLGLVVMRVGRSWGTGVVRLFWMWLAAMGVMNFVGYCFIAPFAQGGDTGQVLALLGAPATVYILVALVGVGGQFLLARRFAIEVKRYAGTIPDERRLAYFPWLIGTPILVFLALVELLLLSVPALYAGPILAYSVAFAVFAPMQFIFTAKVTNRLEPLRLQPVSRRAIGVVVGVAALDVILAAVGGIRLG